MFEPSRAFGLWQALFLPFRGLIVWGFVGEEEAGVGVSIWQAAVLSRGTPGRERKGSAGVSKELYSGN